VVASLILAALVAGSGSAAGGVLCVKKKGQVVQRPTACKKKESPLILANVPGTTGPAGPTGNQGPQGPQGAAGSNGSSVFKELPIDLASLPDTSSVAHLDLPAGNYLVMGKMTVDSVLSSLVDCSLNAGDVQLDTAGVGSALGLRSTLLAGVVTLPEDGSVDIACPPALAQLSNLRLTAIDLGTRTNVPLP
jgi:hypothetical protein